MFLYLIVVRETTLECLFIIDGKIGTIILGVILSCKELYLVKFILLKLRYNELFESMPLKLESSVLFVSNNSSFCIILLFEFDFITFAVE